MSGEQIDSDDDGEWEDWAEPEEAPTRCLFTERIFSSAAECLSHAVQEYQLDLVQVSSRRAATLFCIDTPCGPPSAYDMRHAYKVCSSTPMRCAGFVLTCMAGSNW